MTAPADSVPAMPLVPATAAPDEPPRTVPAMPLLIGGMPKPPADTAGAADEVVLNFPTTAVGTVLLSKHGEPADIRPASGAIRVPVGWTVQLNLSDSVTDGACLSTLPPDGVHILIANGLDDDALAGLAHYRVLTYLRLGSAVTGAGFARLAHLDMLTMLSVSSPKVDDAAVEQLGMLPELLSIHLDPCALTDAGIATLARLPKLTTISITSPGLTDAAAQILAQSSTLQGVTLHSGSLTNASIHAFAGAGALESLTLTGSFDDAGLLELASGFPALQNARIDGPGVTNEGVMAAFAVGITAQLNGQWFSPKAAERLRQRGITG